MTEQDFPKGFDYQGDIYRAPREAGSIILQATIGCSHNKCTFCGSFRNKKFAFKDQSIIERDLMYAERHCKHINRVFVIDSNALVMPMERWEWLLTSIKAKLPWVTGVACYGRATDVQRKTDEDLLRLKELGLDGVYVGVESGCDEVLTNIRKGADSELLETQCKRVMQAGLFLRVTVLLGLGGKELTMRHARDTGKLLTAINPYEVSVLSLMRMPGTELDDQMRSGEVRPLTDYEILQEMHELLLNTNMTQGLFDCAHASNYLSFMATMPDQKQAALEYLEKGLSGEIKLKPESWRSV